MLKKFKGEMILLTASVLWGTCFVFQKIGMDYIGPYTLGAFRFLLGALVLFPFILIADLFKKRKITEIAKTSELSTINEPSKSGLKKQLYLGGVFCGFALFAAASLQQIGLQYTTAGKAGFITSLEIVLVALFMIFLQRKVHLNIVIGVFLAVLGMYLLCMSGGFTLSEPTQAKGDFFELIAIIFWAIQVLLIDKYSKFVDVIKLSFYQFLTTGLLSMIFMFLFERPHWTQIQAGAVPILYTAIIEVAIAYTLQVIGQKYTPPVVAAVILSLEAVFSAISGALLLHEVMSLRNILGCISMLAAVIICQIPISFKVKTNKKLSVQENS